MSDGYGLLPTGFVPMPADVVESQVITSLQGIDGLESLQVGDEEAFAKWASIHAEREALIWALAHLVWQSGSRELSTGASLDNNLSLIGNSRLQEEHSTVALTLYNHSSSSPVGISADSQARQSSTGVIWELTEDTEIPGNDPLYTALPITDILWQEDTQTVRATFGSQDFSIVSVGDEITITGSTNPINDGTFPITAVSDASNYLEYLHTGRSDDTDDETGSPAEADIGDSITVLAQSLSAGPYEASIGSINEIVTPISGWDACINLAVALVGRDQELDSPAKARAAIETASSSGGTLEAVKQAIEALPGWIYVSGEENCSNVAVGGLKANSIHMTVVGCTDQDIVDAIGRKRADGIDTNGDHSGTYTDSTGNNETIYFSRVTEVNPYLIVNITKDSTWPTDGVALVKAALTGTTWTHGQDLLNYLLVTAVGAAGIPGILTIAILQSKATDPPVASTNVVIASTEVLNITADRITVNVS